MRAARCALRLAGVALAALALGSCAAIAPHFERPQLSVIGVQLEGAQLFSQRFRIRLRVENPNDRELPIQSITFTMEVDGERFGDGATAAPFTIPARGAGSFDAIVTTDLATTLVKVLPKLKDGAPPVEYRLAGVVNTELAFLRTIPFDQRGSVSLSSRAP
jgi:LEA14-like dessication related protein